MDIWCMITIKQCLRVFGISQKKTTEKQYETSYMEMEIRPACDQLS